MAATPFSVYGWHPEPILPLIDSGDEPFAAVVAAGPATEHRWGRWQFPTVEIAPHGRHLLFVHVEPDSASSYGKQRKVYVSRDHRRHWQEDAAVTQGAYGLRLPTGEWLRTETVATTPAASITLPAQFRRAR